MSDRLTADQHPIIIDGQFDDWTNVQPVYQDTLGDSFSNADFGSIWLADDQEFLFICIELNETLDATENNSLVLFLDTDNDPNTGHSVAGLGAELEWMLGSRFGLFHLAGTVEPISFSDIGFRGGPTVTSSVFEFAVSKDSLPDGINPLFDGNQIRLAMIEQAGKDQIPNQGDAIVYELGQGTLPSEDVIPLARESSTDLRMMTHNVLFDSPWNPAQQPRFGRLWSAVAPDIIMLQEIYDHSLNETLQLVSNLVPPPLGTKWSGARNSDCFTISQFPIISSFNLSGNLVTLLDTTSVLQTNTLIVNAHLPCCGNESGRQFEVDQIMAFLRESQLPGGSLQLAANTPIVITGDLNLVGEASQLATLVTGDIGSNTQFGPDFTPDWDGTSFRNVFSRQTEKRMGYTWRADGSSFWPGQLDYFIFTDSVLELRNNYLLYTPEMANPNSLGLNAGDSLVSDHLVFVTDFRPVTTVLHGDVNQDGAINLLDVEPFIDRLSSGTYQPEADINKDGQVNLLDVATFIELLSG